MNNYQVSKPTTKLHTNYYINPLQIYWLHIPRSHCVCDELCGKQTTLNSLLSKGQPKLVKPEFSTVMKIYLSCIWNNSRSCYCIIHTNKNVWPYIYIPYYMASTVIHLQKQSKFNQQKIYLNNNPIHWRYASSTIHLLFWVWRPKQAQVTPITMALIAWIFILTVVALKMIKTRTL